MTHPVVIRVRDSDGNAEYDMLYVADEFWTAKEAVEIVDRAIEKVKAADPEEYSYEDLNEELAKQSFVPLEIHNAEGEM